MSGREHLDLLNIVRQVRRRWRMKIAMRGATAVLGIGAVLLLAAAFGLQWVRFAPAFIIGFRVALVLAFLIVAGLFVVRPLLRRVSDEQVALYLEEHEPRLEAAIISAVEHAKAEGTGSTLISDDSRSPALVARLVESAIEKCTTTRAPLQVERKMLARYGAGAAAVVALALVTFGVGPNYLRQAISALLSITGDVQAAAPYRITVTPGDATIPKGADQGIVAKLSGFTTPDATLYVRTTADGAFEKMPLIPGEHGSFDAMLFDVAAQTEYYVEAEGVQSRHFTLNVVDLPYVQTLKLEYRFPAYTGMEPEVVENGGDIAVIGGTQVLAQITPTMKTPGGRIIVNDKQQVPLKVAADGTLSAAFVAAADGFYRVELDAPTGERVAASPQFTIDILSDQAPRVSFSKPGRDTTATSIEEVYVEAHAEDDFGVRDLELVYAVNGGDEKTVKLFSGDRRLADVSAGHTFYLEELGVKAGDSVSYYARAADNNGEAGNRQTSDIYFMRIRPFKKDFRAAQSMAGGGGGGGGGGMNEVNALSEQQRQIISATFNIQRDRKDLPADKLKERTVVVGLSQSRLREQVEGLVTRMTSRFLQPDPSFKKIAALLPQAIAEMKLAEAQLAQVKPEGALPPENKALQYLQTAEEEYETQVSSGRGGGGGGGGGGSQVARELAEIFEMDLDKLANQYETADRAMQQSADQQVDELMEKLKELARRQEQEAEQQRRRALQNMAGGASGGGAQQRQLAEQAEEMARRLEKLSRERPELADSARQMRDVADSMRKAAAAGGGQGGAQASQALDRLKEAQRRLQRNQADRTKRDIEDAQRQAEEIARDQKAIISDVSGLPSKQGDARRQSANELNARKSALENKIGDLEKQLDRGAAEADREEKDAARKMAEAAGAIRDTRLRDKLRYSRQMLGRTNRETMDVVERDIADSIENVRRRLDQAAQALGTGSQGKPEEKENTVDRAQRMARGMESLEQRMRERLERGGNRRDQNQQGQQQGQQGRAGQQGRQGQQGQGQQSQGQRGQQGQGGQEGQGQQGHGGSEGGDSQGGSAARGGSDVGRGNVGDPGARYGWGGGWDGDWRGYLNPEDIRQFRGEVRQWANEGADLRRRLMSENIDPKELDDILRRLRQLDDDRVYKDPAELQRLQQYVTEGLKRFEYSLRRQTEEKDKEVVLSGSDEVPDAFRPLVEQYYRSLSKGASR